MIHSKQCMEVIEKCDFPEDSYPWIEKLCMKFTSKQIISLVWSKDKKGEHDWDWFAPFFESGYIPCIIHPIVIDMNKNFWDTYVEICNFVESFNIGMIDLISMMSEDTLRLKEAIKKSKPNIKYVYKVWLGMEPVETVAINNAQMVDIKKHKVKTSEFS